MGFSGKQLILIFGMLLTGTINTVSKKMQLDCIAAGYYNHSANDTRTEHHFNKPWFQTLLMFLGEVLCFFGFLIMRSRKRSRLIREGTYDQIMADTTNRGLVNNPIFSWWFLIPTCCDLLGTTIAGIGMLFVDASIWQMMRGSLIVFAGLLSVIFLKRKLYAYHWTGMICTMIGLALVGTKSVFSGHSMHHTAGQSALGVALVLVGAFISATQMILEEVFLKKRGFHPLQTVGMEGFFGCILMMGVALPSVHYIPGDDLNGSYENLIDGLYQIGDNGLLLGNCILYILSIAFFNYFGLSITRYLSAVHRTLIDALRTTFVWLISLILFYSTDERFGEPFDTAWGLIQIDGFAFLILGTLIYNKVLDLTIFPFFAEPVDEPLIPPEQQVEPESSSTSSSSTNSPSTPHKRSPIAHTNQAYYGTETENC